MSAQERPRFDSMSLCLIPIEVVSEILTEWEIKYSGEHEQMNPREKEREKVSVMGPYQWLSFQTGLHPSYIGKLRKGRVRGKYGYFQKWVSFHNVDKIICAIDRVHEWHTGRLAPYYGPIEIGKHEWHLRDAA